MSSKHSLQYKLYYGTTVKDSDVSKEVFNLLKEEGHTFFLNKTYKTSLKNIHYLGHGKI